MRIGGIVAAVYLILAFKVRTLALESLAFAAPELPVRAAVFILSLLLYMAVHESGHRIAGMVQGWRCIRFGFGPFEFARNEKGWKVERVKFLPGAFVRHVPPSFTHFRRQKATTLLSGPLASLLFGASCAVMAYTSTSALEFWIFASFAVWTPLGFFELIPFRTGGIQSDGASLLQVIRGGEGLDAMYRDIFAEASNFTSVRHKDWPREVMERLASGEDRYDAYLAYLHYLDSGEMETASRFMIRLMAAPGEDSPYYACEAAWFLAIYQDDAEEARAWLARCASRLDQTMVMRAEAAVAWAEGNADEAERLANRALAHYDASQPSGSDVFEKERLAGVLQRVEASRRAGVPA